MKHLALCAAVLLGGAGAHAEASGGDPLQVQADKPGVPALKTESSQPGSYVQIAKLAVQPSDFSVRARVSSSQPPKVLAQIAPAEPSGADAEAAGMNLSGSVRAGYWSSDRRLNDRANFTPTSLWLKTSPSLGGGWYAHGEGWVLDDRPLDGDRRPRAELREGYAGWRGDNIEVSVGRRIVAWGRADRINPTDVITTRDYTRLFIEDDDQRRGSLMATAAYSVGDVTATVLWLPEFRPNVYPIPTLQGFSVRQEADRIVADQVALRLDRTGGSFDWSLIYFNGVNRNPAASLIGVSPTTVSVQTVYNRVQTWGADFATNAGGFGLRGEVAYSQPGGSQGNVFNPRPFVEAVVGVDRNVTGSFNVNLQFVFEQVMSFNDPSASLDPLRAYIFRKAALVNNQGRETQYGPAIRMAYTGLNDTLTLELTAMYFVSDHSFAIRPRSTYALTDSVKLSIGADFFNGPSNSYFGQLRRNTTFLSELRFNF